MEVVSIVECIDCECASVIYGLDIFSNMTQRKKNKKNVGIVNFCQWEYKVLELFVLRKVIFLA